MLSNCLQQRLHKFPRMRVIQPGQTSVPITHESNIDPNVCLDSPLFNEWKNKLPNDWLVTGLHIQSMDKFGDRVAFIKMNASILNTKTNIFKPTICFLRGGSVAILIIIQCEGKEYVIIADQQRVPASLSKSFEIPAGMLDGHGDVKGVTITEIREETGLYIDKIDLVNLSELVMRYCHPTQPILSPGMYPSPGGCDEKIVIFLYRCSMTKDQLNKLQGKLTGNKEEEEAITVRIMPYDYLWTTQDAKAICAWAQLEGLKRMNPKLDEILPPVKVYTAKDE